MSDECDPVEIAARAGVLEADVRAVLDDLRECDPISEAGDGVILDETADGAIECVADSEGMTVLVDPDSGLGERLAWHAGHRGESPEEVLLGAIEEFLEEERQ